MTVMTKPTPEPQSWGFVEGDAITAELTTVRRLGGGSAYEAYLEATGLASRTTA